MKEALDIEATDGDWGRNTLLLDNVFGILKGEEQKETERTLFPGDKWPTRHFSEKGKALYLVRLSTPEMFDGVKYCVLNSNDFRYRGLDQELVFMAFIKRSMTKGLESPELFDNTSWDRFLMSYVLSYIKKYKLLPDIDADKCGRYLRKLYEV